MDFDLGNPLADLHDDHSDSVTSLFLIESDHMPSQNYFLTLQDGDFDISVRREAIASVSQFSCNFDPMVSYLAVNYIDRFLSRHGMLQPKQWILKLLAISCVSLAAKMNKIEFSLNDFQFDGVMIFDPQTIQRMEFIILGALKWRMRSITPFSFVSFFISLSKLEDPPMLQALKATATEIIFKSQNDTKLWLFKPSIIAASALLHATHELFPSQYPRLRKALSNCSYVNKENMLQCYNAVQAMVLEGYEFVFEAVLSSVTPVNVLDQQFSSSENGSNDTSAFTTTTTTTTTTMRLEKGIKRRKISGY